MIRPDYVDYIGPLPDYWSGSVATKKPVGYVFYLRYFNSFLALYSRAKVTQPKSLEVKISQLSTKISFNFKGLVPSCILTSDAKHFSLIFQHIYFRAGLGHQWGVSQWEMSALEISAGRSLDSRA